MDEQRDDSYARKIGPWVKIIWVWAENYYYFIEISVPGRGEGTGCGTDF